MMKHLAAQAARIAGCRPIALKTNADARGCLFEVFREEWNGAFPTVQWNACVSRAGALRGVHVHVDYDEYYTLLTGRVFLALRDARRRSPTFGVGIGAEWAAADALAIPVPAGVAHAVYFLEDSVLSFGLSSYWRADRDVVGCHWDRLDPAIRWPADTAVLSGRDSGAGSFEEMVAHYEALSAQVAGEALAPAQ
jgi:dTDP-4-dehydrorhamnose 3,5-epimerase